MKYKCYHGMNVDTFHIVDTFEKVDNEWIPIYKEWVALGNRYSKYNNSTYVFIGTGTTEQESLDNCVRNMKTNGGLHI